eukprot:CAMPEP_0170559942 /NCGR_PEP_ID=MMETSP0211-20121228/46062_1 /TAXON_ID=311385 /ORGANISM="Pseudokeronopsis sp., Strain OXSARD2" /LENGTH=105 /DNA_ID=CAMNT_0010873597 /DNA_START=582 /DNA_END=899 /DNA_ORIENTATION=-
MAATSRPDLVDVALLRPGRVDKAIYCGFPSLEERKELLDIYLKKFNFLGKEGSSLMEDNSYDLFLHEIAEKIQDYTCADIKGMIQNAQLKKMSLMLKQNEEDQNE